MVVIVLLALVLMSVVASWEKQLPTGTETYAELSARRRVLSIAAIPVSLVVVAAFVVVAVGVAGAENQRGYSNELLVGFAGAASLGFLYLFAVGSPEFARHASPRARRRAEPQGPPWTVSGPWPG